MKNMGVVLGIVLMSSLVVACQTTNETPSNDGKDSTQKDEGEEENYTEEQVAGDFLIYGEWLDGTDLMFYFTRTTDDMTYEERFRQSLIESDPSQRELFSTMTNFEIDGTVVNLYFNENDDLSMASTESKQFWEALHEVGFRYGMGEMNLFNQNGERGLVFAENRWEETVQLEPEPNRGYYVVSSEKSERGKYTYISGAVAGEDISTEDGKLFDFEQTIEAMATVENDDGEYISGIYEGIEIEEARIDGKQAVVKYHVNDGVEVSQQEREDFEQVLQLAALDFQVDELKIVNETDQVISSYPLLDEIDDNMHAFTEDDNNAEDKSDTGEQENTGLTKEEAIEKMFDYVDEHEASHREDVKAMVQDDEDEEGKYLVQAFVYSGEEDDDAQMTNTIGWYLVDKETGEVEEKEF